MQAVKRGTDQLTGAHWEWCSGVAGLTATVPLKWSDRKLYTCIEFTQERDLLGLTPSLSDTDFKGESSLEVHGSPRRRNVYLNIRNNYLLILAQPGEVKYITKKLRFIKTYCKVSCSVMQRNSIVKETNYTNGLRFCLVFN